MLTIVIPKRESPLYASFVLPNYCAKLKEMGFPTETVYQWQVYPDKISLGTYAFDEDCYYKDGNKLKDLLFPDACQFPAFTIKDMEKCIPSDSYQLFMEEGSYCLTFFTNDSTFKFRDNRLPDVFARALIAITYKGFLNLTIIRELILGE